MTSYDELCARMGLKADRPHMIRCAVHDDRTASLSIKRGDYGNVLAYCFAGCDAKEVLEALEVCPSPSRYVFVSPPTADEMTLESEYSYTNADGKTLATKQRFRLPDGGKSFRWRSSTEGLPVDQSLLPLYNLDVLAGEQQDRLVWVVEGEKDVDTLRSHGLVATCNPEGASGAKSAYTESRWSELRNRNVCIIADNDPAGAQHADKVAAVLLPMVKSLVMLSPLPNVGPKGDASDYLTTHTLEDLKGLYSAALKPSQSAGIALASSLLATASAGLLEAQRAALEPPVITRLVERIEYASWEREAQAMTSNVRTVPSPFPLHNDICRKQASRQGMKLGWHIVVAGRPGEGKTTLGLNFVSHAALKGRRVGVISLEMGKDEIMANLLSIATQTNDKDLEAIPGKVNEGYLNAARTFDSYMKDTGGGVYISEMPRSDLKTVRRAVNEMCEEGCEMIMVDYMQRITVSGKEDDYGRLTETSNTLQGMAKERNFVSIALSQFNRAATGTNFSPTPQGMKGSSAIEDDAGQILMIDNSKKHMLFHEGQDLPWGVDTVLKVGKNRYGPTQLDIPIRFVYDHLHMSQRVA